MKSERLFEAIGGVDSQLVLRSGEYRRKHSRFMTALAACLAVACITATVMLANSSHSPVVTIQTGTGENGTHLPEDTPPALTLDGGAVGQLHLCQLRQDETSLPAFLINVNKKMYTITEVPGGCDIRPVSQLPEGGEFPPVDFTIRYQAGVSPAAAAETVKAALAGTYAQISEPEETGRGLYLAAGDGTEWNAAQAEIHLISDGGTGTFVLTARYFTEATEGHGVLFRDMAGTFQVIPSGTTVPEWMETLRLTADRLMAALFSNRQEDIAAFLEEGAMVDGYREDISEYVSISSIHYEVDDGQSPTFAVVSVRHSTGWEDSYNYLTMELCYRDNRWFLRGAGIEK